MSSEGVRSGSQFALPEEGQSDPPRIDRVQRRSPPTARVESEQLPKEVLMRRGRPFIALAIPVLATLVPTGAAADPTDEFDACLTRADAGSCGDTFSYGYGDVVVLKARVSSVHEEAVVQRKAPGADRWENVDTVSISDAGRMKWRWHTHRADADQGHPYRLRLRIPGHGTSDVVEAWILFGE